jgi:phage shock protein A
LQPAGALYHGGMWKVLKRQWKYLTAKLSGNLEERADPKVQLEQAIADAQDQHRRLVEQAANVIARQKQTELRLHRAMDELEKTNASTRQALVLAQQATAKGDTAKAAEYNQTAEAFANRLIASEKQIEDLKTESLQTTSASQQAKAAVQQNSLALQERLAERQKLLSQLDQAKMQEQLNAAMTDLSQSVDHEVPSLDQVRDKIEARYAKAIGTSELTGNTVESRMLEVQQASIGNAARSRLDDLREQMGITAGTPEPPAVSAAATSGELSGSTALDDAADMTATPVAESVHDDGDHAG